MSQMSYRGILWYCKGFNTFSPTPASAEQGRLSRMRFNAPCRLMRCLLTHYNTFCLIIPCNQAGPTVCKFLPAEL